MKYVLLFVVLLAAPNYNYGQIDWFPEEDTTQTGLPMDIMSYPWSIHFDLTRLIYQTPSIQVSTSYRLNDRFGVESEFNYYLNSKIKHNTTRLDALSVEMSRQKSSWFISGIGKVYFGDKRTQYIAARLVGGSIHLDLSRKVCIEAQPSTSDKICQCLKTEDRQLIAQKNQFLYGLRYGIDIPVTPRIRLNTFIDFGKHHYSQPRYQHLKHACDPAWPNFEKPPKTDGIFADFNEWSNDLYFSFGVKIGYAFK